MIIKDILFKERKVKVYKHKVINEGLIIIYSGFIPKEIKTPLTRGRKNV
jgi:hypothetical protein